MNLMEKAGRELVHVCTSTGRVFAFVGVSLFAVAGFAAESISITATPRYPWNGKVDLKFTIDGTSGTKYDTSFTAKDVAGGTNLTMKTLYKSNGSAANVAKEQLLPGTYNWVWDATADLGECTVLKVVVVGKTEYNEADAKRYMVVDLKSGAVSYMATAPSGGWASNPYKQTKWAFQRIEAGSFVQSSGTSSKRTVKISKPYYLSVLPLTAYQANQLESYPPPNNVVSIGDNYDGWPQDTSTIYFKDSSSPNWPRLLNELTSMSTYYYMQSKYSIFYQLKKKTNLTFSVPTEAQLTFARKSMSIGSNWIFTRDWYASDLGTATVTDPCQSNATVDDFGKKYMAAVTESSRGMACISGWGGHEVCLFVCLVLDK